jgi:hypothetical protein
MYAALILYETFAPAPAAGHEQRLTRTFIDVATGPRRRLPCQSTDTTFPNSATGCS